MVNTELEFGRPWADGGDLPAENSADLVQVRLDGLHYQFEYGRGPIGDAGNGAPIAMSLEASSARNERLVGEANLGHGGYEAVIVPRSVRSEAEWMATIDTVECSLRLTVPGDVFETLAQMVRAGVPLTVSVSLPGQMDGDDVERGWDEADYFELPVGQTVRAQVERFAFGHDTGPTRPRSGGFWTKAIFAFVVLVIVSGLIVGQGGF